MDEKLLEKADKEFFKLIESNLIDKTLLKKIEEEINAEMGFVDDNWLYCRRVLKHYLEQSNLTLAKNLQGKLLLVHGEMDRNVNPASTLRLAAELIKANKDFDLLILPNAGHGAIFHPYFTRKTWDYFVKHLLGKEPPKGYKINTLVGVGEMPQ